MSSILRIRGEHFESVTNELLGSRRVVEQNVASSKILLWDAPIEWALTANTEGAGRCCRRIV